jgi:hypothetical protein
VWLILNPCAAMAAAPRKDFPSAFISIIKRIASCWALSLDSLPSSLRSTNAGKAAARLEMR